MMVDPMYLIRPQNDGGPYVPDQTLRMMVDPILPTLALLELPECDRELNIDRRIRTNQSVLSGVLQSVLSGVLQSVLSGVLQSVLSGVLQSVLMFCSRFCLVFCSRFCLVFCSRLAVCVH
ncbi:hypothetical protein EYF80_055911 [Liparis tanakae]|uniref:Uncharacterized protein n=1 Tax=Liparis tanakae TaxID=230148 RepID=A0A4Z2EYT5_9TELE|nr:hypothetical protein EYF80_055911 [Liparis tanakae]